MSNGRDGGKWALAGFLYQIVGMLSITARAYGPIAISNRDESDEVDAFLTLISVGEGLQAHHERFEQDVVFARDDECVLAQFKYSTAARKICRGELGEIIRKLDEGARQAELQGQDVTACVLITNRELTSKGRAAKQLWETERVRDRGYELRCFYGSMENLIRKLREFGREYGLFDQEIETGIDNLIGRVFRQTGEPFGASVDRGHLVESLTGYREARRLTVTSVGELAYEQLNQFGETIRVDRWNDTPVRRKVFEDIIETVNERALVGLYGDGGCGKSVILWQLLRQMLDQASGCCMVAIARDLPDSWVTGTVHRWRTLTPGSRSGDDREKAISRLIIANPDLHRRILWLALDGLDEGVRFDQRPHVQEIVQWFWNKDRECQESDNPPSATLIVSCRRKEDLEDEWLNLQYDYPGKRPPNIRVGDFSIAEIAEAARQSVPELYHRILSSYGDQLELLESSYSPIPSRHAFPYPQSDSIDDRLLGILKHPAMWRALLNLEEPDRIGVIEGEVRAIYCLAHEFIGWFYSKLRQREQRLQDLSRDTLIEILRAIAHRSSVAAANSRDENWVEPACQIHQHQINRREAIVLYNEAILAGLITRNARLSWRWRHPIVRDYLASNVQVD